MGRSARRPLVAVCLDPRSPHNEEIYLGIDDVAAHLGWQVHSVCLGRCLDVDRHPAIGWIVGTGIRVPAGTPRVTIGEDAYLDQRAVGRLAGRHLQQHGIMRGTTLLCPAFADHEERCRGFRDIMGHVPGYAIAGDAGSPSGLLPWLLGLPQPIGVFAADDDLAVLLVQACFLAGLQVPNPIAVITAGHETAKSLSAPYPISQVHLPYRSVGRTAADRLAQQLVRRRVRRPARIMPMRVIAR